MTCYSRRDMWPTMHNTGQNSRLAKTRKQWRSLHRAVTGQRLTYLTQENATDLLKGSRHAQLIGYVTCTHSSHELSSCNDDSTKCWHLNYWVASPAYSAHMCHMHGLCLCAWNTGELCKNGWTEHDSKWEGRLLWAQMGGPNMPIRNLSTEVGHVLVNCNIPPDESIVHCLPAQHIQWTSAFMAMTGDKMCELNPDNSVWQWQCHSLSLAPVNPDWFHLPGFTVLVPACPGSPGQNPEGHKTVVVVVVCMAVMWSFAKLF